MTNRKASHMKLLKTLSTIIIFLCLLALWSGLVRHVALGKSLGLATDPIKHLSSFPSTVKEVLLSIKSAPPTWIKIPSKDSLMVNKLTYDLPILNSVWNNKKNQWEIVLLNLKTDDTLQSWIIQEKDFLGDNYQRFSNVRPMHSLILDDGSLVVSMFGSNSLARYNRNSELIWKNSEYRTHHSVNINHQGNLWICTDNEQTRSNKGVKNTDGQMLTFRDNNITLFESKSGRVLYTKSISEILFENDLDHLLYTTLENQWDPIHVNDIQPLLTNTTYGKQGNVFISLRNISTILLFDPITNKVIWHKSFHPLMHQHDIDILNESEISIFNNNHINGKFRSPLSNDVDHVYELINESEFPYSQMLVYNFELDSFYVNLSNVFSEQQILTPTEGLLETLPNGDVYVENQNNGLIYVLNQDGLIYKNAFPTPEKDFFYMPNWTRVYLDLPTYLKSNR